MTLFISKVSFKYLRTLPSFFQSCSVLLLTLVHRNATVGSMSGLTLLDKCSNFATTEWKIADLPSSNSSDSSLMVNKFLSAGVAIFLDTSSPYASIASFICVCIDSDTVSFLLICIFIPRNWWLSPLVIVNSPKCFEISPKIHVTTSSSSCDTLLSSTYQHIVHCFPLIILFATQRSYGFTWKPMPRSVSTYKLYHNNADSMHPYSARSRCKYNTLFFPSPLVKRSYSGLTWHMMSAKSPLSTISVFLSSGIFACRYAPGTSKIATFLFSTTSITNDASRPSRETVGDEYDSFSFKKSFCFFPLAHVLPLSIPDLFSLIKVTASNACFFCSSDKVCGSTGLTTGFPGIGPSWICLNSFIMAAIALSPNFLMPFLADIWVNNTPVALFMWQFTEPDS